MFLFDVAINLYAFSRDALPVSQQGACARVDVALVGHVAKNESFASNEITSRSLRHCHGFLVCCSQNLK